MLLCTTKAKWLLKKRRLLKAAVKGDFSCFQTLQENSTAISSKDIVEPLLPDSGIPIDAIMDKSGRSLLHLAALEGHAHIVRLLLRKGVADINAIDRYGWTALHYACYRGHTDVVELLRSGGANVNAKTLLRGWTPLHCATEHPTVVGLLLRSGAKVNGKSECGYQTPLHCACMLGCVSTVELLINSGADVNAEGTGNWTPLDWANRFGRREIIELLQKNGANNTQNKDKHDGDTVLQHACRKEVERRMLLEQESASSDDQDGTWLRTGTIEKSSEAMQRD
jgi:ankyrin repeat protein